MIDFFYFPTPNCHKISIMLEETGLPYVLNPVNITKGEQFTSEFLRISPNNRIPAILDRAPNEGGPPIPIFESGAILLYLADKTGQLLPTDARGRVAALKWLFWQIGGLGPICGQNHHFQHHTAEPIPYAIKRFVDESSRLYAVLDRQLADREFIAERYSIADIACFPWVGAHKQQSQNLDDFPNVKRWFLAIGARDAVKRALARGEEVEPNPVVTKESERILFGQSAETVRKQFS